MTLDLPDAYRISRKSLSLFYEHIGEPKIDLEGAMLGKIMMVKDVESKTYQKVSRGKVRLLHGSN